MMLAWKISPCLAAGNTVVLKPAQVTPLTSLKFAELAARAGFPRGVINILPGSGESLIIVTYCLHQTPQHIKFNFVKFDCQWYLENSMMTQDQLLRICFPLLSNFAVLQNPFFTNK